MLIDSHHHLWKYSAVEYPWINHQMGILLDDFWISELREVANECGVDGFVTVQARQSIAETETLLALAATEPLIRGVVGWLPLADPQLGSILDQFADQPQLKGVRHVVQDEPDDMFLLRDDFNRGVAMLAERDLVYDLLIFAKQLPAAIEFVDRHPSQPMIVDHIAKPKISYRHPIGQVDKTWAANLRELARRPNVMCKFSGVLTEVREDTWDPDLIRPYWDLALEVFTPKRLMFGSDWPVCLLRCGYATWLAVVRLFASELSATEQADLYAGNAIEAYRLST